VELLGRVQAPDTKGITLVCEKNEGIVNVESSLLGFVVCEKK
jgi:hypothetical protein